MTKCDDDSSVTAPTATSTRRALQTPSHTVISDDAYGVEQDRCSIHQDKVPKYSIAEVVPEPGNTYVIRARDSGLAIAIDNRELKLMDWDCAGDKSFHWICEEKGGYFAFKNPVGCKYIGYDGYGGMMAQVELHRLWEDFCPRKHPEGGFLLLNRGRWWWTPLEYVDVDKSGRKLVRNPRKGTVWEFLKI